MYPNYRYTPKHKNEKDDDKTPIKGKGKGKSIPKALQLDTASQSSSQSSFELPPSPPWNKTTFGDAMPDQSVDQLAASTDPAESFFDQALSADAPADYPISTGTNHGPDDGTNGTDYPIPTSTYNGSGDGINGINKDIASVANDDPADDAAKNADVYNGLFTFGACTDNVSNENVEMDNNWVFGYVDIDAVMRNFDFDC